MNEVKLAKLLQSELSKINNNSHYKRLFTINNNLDSFNIINRALIIRQCPKAFDVRSRLQWSIAGKNVKEGAKPIFVMNPILDSTYRFTDTGEELRYGALNPIEISNSLQMGLLIKDTSIIGISIDGLYDIRDTENFNDNIQNKSDNLKTNVFNLLVATEELMEVEINKIDSGKVQYFSKTKQLFIPKSTYRNIVCPLIDIIVTHMLSEDNQSKFSLAANIKNNRYRKLIEETAKFSLKTKFGIIDDIDFTNYISDLDQNTFVDIAKTIDSIVCIVTSLIPSESGKEVRSSTHSILSAKRAENLADILESNLIKSILND